MANERQYAVLGPLAGGIENRAFLGCEVLSGAPNPDSPVVIVWLPDEVAKDPRQVSRLQRETAFVTQLRHACINRIHGLECFEEGWARVLVYEDGESLTRLLAKLRESDRSLEPLHAARIMVDACDAVHFAHEEGLAKYAGRPIVHGGLRPDNLFATFTGYTQVGAYGASTLPGSPAYAYLAPEQIIGGKATASPSTDTYALGAILYELLAGKPPFADAPDIERAVLTGDPPTISEPGLSGRLGNIATTAMSKRGSDRFESVGVMKDAIITALQGEELPTHEVMARFFSGMFPASTSDRMNRKALLDSAGDPDSCSILSRPTGAPAATVSTTSAAIVDPAEFSDERAGREEKTMVDVKVPTGEEPPRASGEEKTSEMISTEIVNANAPNAPNAPSASWESMIAQAAQAASQAAQSAAPTEQSSPEPVVPQRPVVAQPTPVEMRAGLQYQATQPTVPQSPMMPSSPQVMAPPAMQPAPMQPAPMQAQHMQPQPMQPQYGMQPQGPPQYAMQPQQAAHSMPQASMHAAPMYPSQQPYAAQSGVQHSLPQAQYAPAPQSLPSFTAPTVHAHAPQPPPQQRSANGPAAGLRSPAAIPRAPMRDSSAITNFDRKVGDSSRSVLILVLIGAAALLGGIFYWTEAPPEVQLAAQEETRHNLPKELVREALEKAGTEKATDTEQLAATDEKAPAEGEKPAQADTVAETVPAVPQIGTLNLSTDPEVDVYAGNDLLGRTPIVAKLPAGNQKIRFTDKKTGLNVYKTYRVRPGGEVRDHISFGTSELIVEAPDGASIILNSRFIGTAPMEPVKIYEGKYHLKVTLDGKSWADFFDAPPGRKINYKVTLNN